MIVGAALAALSTRFLETLLFGVEPLDPWIFLAMSGATVLVGMLASYLPARRASSVDPAECLKAE